MSRLNWDATGERFFETGVEAGALYVGENPGVAWVGLISVDESPTGGEARPFYQDGIKYLNLAANEEFHATINAFAAPREFDPCDGVNAIGNGLFATQQRRVPFGLSYRTQIGNDMEGQGHAYKLHLVYNALAAPSQRSNATLGGDVQPNTLSWEVSTLPPRMTGRRPTAHFSIDSRVADPDMLLMLENTLYGTDAVDSRLPTVEELIAIFTL